MQAKFLLSLALLVVMTACEPSIANRGNVLDPDKLTDVQTGISTREKVVAALGTPTAISTFDEKTWYYIGRQTEQYSFFDPEVIKQRAVEVRFDDQGVVTSLKDMDLSEAHDIEPAEGSTPTYGNDNTFLKQLFGNLGHPMPAGLGDKHGGQ